MARDDERFAMEEGDKLDAASAALLEETLRADPANFDARLVLLGYFFTNPDRSDKGRARRAEHVVWFILNAPTSDIAGSPLASVDPDDQVTFERGEAAWQTHLDLPLVAPRALLNAAHFFALISPEKSRACLERGESTRPDWSTWAHELGHMSLRQVSVARQVAAQRLTPLRPVLDDAGCRREAATALGHFERALSLCDGDTERFSELANATEAAVECAEDEKAATFAAEILRLAPENSTNRHWRDYVHQAHVARGRIALRRDDRATAIAELLEAGRTGSKDAPVLRSFGPDFALARELLDSGETAAVLAYLDECERFWKAPRIVRWREQLAKGEKPRLHRGFDPDECG